MYVVPVDGVTFSQDVPLSRQMAWVSVVKRAAGMPAVGQVCVNVFEDDEGRSGHVVLTLWKECLCRGRNPSQEKMVGMEPPVLLPPIRPTCVEPIHDPARKPPPGAGRGDPLDLLDVRVGFRTGGLGGTQALNGIAGATQLNFFRALPAVTVRQTVGAGMSQ